MDSKGRVFKTAAIQAPILLEDPVEVQKRREMEAEDLVRIAKMRAEKILTETYETIRKEKEKARREVEQTLADLESRKSAILAELQAEAFKQGMTQVEGQIRPVLEKQAAVFESLVRQTESMLQEILDSNRNQLVDLAVGMAERVIGRIAATDRELVERTAIKAITAARDRQEMRILVNPVDLEVCERLQVRFRERFDDLKKISVDADNRVDPGGVWIETPSGFIDARIRSQLEEMMNSVLPDAENPQTLTRNDTLEVRPLEAGEASEGYDDK